MSDTAIMLCPVITEVMYTWPKVVNLCGAEGSRGCNTSITRPVPKTLSWWCAAMYLERDRIGWLGEEVTAELLAALADAELAE